MKMSKQAVAVVVVLAMGMMARSAIAAETTKEYVDERTTMATAGKYYSSGESVTAAVGNVDTQVKSNENAISGIQDSLVMKSGITADGVAQIGTNKTDIGALQGYFTSGVAKKAASDADGNAISSTYAKSADVATTYATQTALSTATTMGGTAGNYYVASSSVVTAVENLDTQIKTNTNAIGTHTTAISTINSSAAMTSGITAEGVTQIGTNKTDIGALQGYFTEGKANEALKATKDSAGNIISDTYAKSADVVSTYATKEDLSSATKMPEAGNHYGQGDLVIAALGNVDKQVNSNTNAISGINASEVMTSGITATKVGSYDTHIADDDTHVTAEQKITWSGKQDALTTNQLSAVNSGITATNVEQIGTNKADIGTLQGYFTNGVANKAASDADGNTFSSTYAKKATTLAGYEITDAYTKTETYTKGEVNSLVATGSSLGVIYDTDDKVSITLVGTGGTEIGNVKAHDLASGGTFAATTGQVYDQAMKIGEDIADDGSFIKKSATNSVNANIQALDTALGNALKGDTSKNLAIGGATLGSDAQQSVAVGSETSVTGTQSIAIGYKNTITGSHSGAFGDPNVVDGDGSYALGNNNTIAGDNVFVLGNNVDASSTNVSNAVVLGNQSVAVKDAVSVGSPTQQRQIKYVATPTDATDATNKYYVDSSLNRLDNSLTKKVNRLGAKSAAISALHPMGLDDDHKFSASAGLGTYGGQSAAAVGLFYKPNENWMFNVGGAAGKGSVMGNIGVNYRFGAPGSVKTVSTSQVAAQVVALQDTNRSIEAQLKASLSREENLVQRVVIAEKRHQNESAQLKVARTEIEQLKVQNAQLIKDFAEMKAMMKQLVTTQKK